MARSSTVPRPENRYARVKAILAAAAGDNTTDYGGLGRFWELPLDDLIEARLFGIRLIAPVIHACCSDGMSRSASSGLIQALRGVVPFDGSRFPPFMWGGSRVADADIDFIADWIDDGCLPDARVTSLPLPPEGEPGIVERRLIREVAEFQIMTGPSTRRGYRQGELRQRPNLDCMCDEDVDQLRAAFRRIYALDDYPEDRRSYNNQALIHQNHCQHGWERFLPWHRAYLYEFEQNLQDFFPDLALPYWDWNMPQYWHRGVPKKGWVLPKAFKAFLIPAAAEQLVASLNPAPSAKQKAAFLKLAEERKLFTTQHAFFCYVISCIGYTDVTPRPDDQNRRAMIRALVDSNALWYPLRYSAEYHDAQGQSGTINEIIHYHFPSPDDMAQILSLNTFRDFGGGNASHGKLPLVGNGAPFGSPELLKTIGPELLEGLLFSVANWPIKGQEEFIERFKKKTGEPFLTQDALCGYGHPSILAEALEACGAADKIKVAEAIRAMNLTTGPAAQCFPGPIKFDEKGRRVDVPMIFAQWQKGVPITVFPTNLALATAVWPSV
jgi:tyrosinase